MGAKQKHATNKITAKNTLQEFLQKNRRLILIVFFAMMIAFVLSHLTPPVHISSQQHIHIKGAIHANNQ